MIKVEDVYRNIKNRDGEKTICIGKGVIATSGFNALDIIEVCPAAIKLFKMCGKDESEVGYSWGDGLFAITSDESNGRFYNCTDKHHQTNAKYSCDKDNNAVVIRATRHISAGSEIVINYSERGEDE